jgi:hypothetical protein
MVRTAVLLTAATGLILFGLAEADGVHAQSAGARRSPNVALSAYAQARPKLRRPRARIRVSPAYRYPYRLAPSIYPIPYEYEYPGPGAVRQCVSALVPEYRPGGPVITPRMRCWWER